ACALHGRRMMQPGLRSVRRSPQRRAKRPLAVLRLWLLSGGPNFAGDLDECRVLLGRAQIVQRAVRFFVRSLIFGKLAVAKGAGADVDPADADFFALSRTEQLRQLALLDELGFEEVRADKEHGHFGLVERGLNPLEPTVAGADAGIIENSE